MESRFALLPPLLQDHVERCVPDRSDARGTLLHQTGQMRLGPEKPWKPFTAEQTLDARTTGFVWHARFAMAPLVTAVVEDAFEAGKGRLDVKIWGVVPVAHERGLAIDRGEAERYLAELVWCPSAFLYNPDLHFETLDEHRVRVWVVDEETYVDLTFDEAGDIHGIRTTTRSRDGVIQPWAGRFDAYRTFPCGVRAPSGGEVWWEAPDGNFFYWRGEIDGLERR